MARLKLVAMATGLLSLASADWSQGEVNVDHMYFDLSSGDMSTNNTQECYQQCLNTNGCKGWVVCPASCGCGSKPGVSFCWLKSDMANYTSNNCRISGFVPRILLPQKFVHMPVGSVQPGGWLRDELTVQAQGLTGYLSKFWADIQNSTWVGGNADGGLHERTPYWLNGLVPLSYLVQDANIQAQRDSYLQYIMKAQLPSGWLGPDDMPTNGDQYWGRFNIILSLIQYYEGSGDAGAITVIFNYLAEAQRRMAGTPLGDWAVVRAQDFIMALFWLADNFDSLKGVPPGFTQAFLMDLAYDAHSQMLSNGGDWKTFFDTDDFPTSAACDGPGTPCNMLTHGVNIGQAIKSEAVWYRRSHDLTDISSTYIRMQKLDTYHGVPSGMFQADEHLAGNMPSHGTETCAVVEAIVSYATAAAIIGDPLLYERAERITYNALPAAMTKNMWERVYLQQSNEINAVHEDPHIFYTDGDDSATFSLEGNYGCCTANMHAGWPKFTYRAIATSPADGGVAVTMWAPVTATTSNATTVNVNTAYPFGDTAAVTVTPAAGVTAPMPVYLRIPSWAAGATLSINGGAAVPLVGSNGTFYPAQTVAGTAPTVFTVNFNPTIRVEAWYNGAVAVLRGPLLYTAWIGQNISVAAQYAFNSQDLAVTSTAAWNVALVINDRSNPGADLTFQQLMPGPTSVPYNSTAIPVAITGYARVVNSWGTDKNAAAAPPTSPACATAGACGASIPITLVPFGSTHVRMTVLPTA